MTPFEQILQRITYGLDRKTVTTCSEYAQKYRIMGKPYPGNYSFKHHPWCREMHDCRAEMMIGQKGAQLGFTEVALNKTFFANDIEGESVLYVLPSDDPDASNFSKSRFDPALELSPHLNNLYSDVKNVRHKRAGSANLFITGSRSRARLKSVPTGRVMVDELEEMDQENIALIPERMSGQQNKQAFYLSTPTLPKVGINKLYLDSTENHYMFRCPSCSRMTELVFPDCLIITSDDYNSREILDSHLVCKECKNILPHDTKYQWLNEENAQWVKTNKDRLYVGYHVNQLYSPTVSPHEIATLYLKGLTDRFSEQEFYNSKLGIPHETEGARVVEEDIINCTKNFKMFRSGSPQNALITMGIDVGVLLHVWIDQWIFRNDSTDINIAAKARTIYVGTCKHFAELDKLFLMYRPASVVIDKNPETRMTKELAIRFPGLVRRCEYNQGQKGIETKEKNDEDEYTISVDRTSWLDVSLGRIQNKNIDLPMDLPMEAKSHLQALVKMYKKDQLGNPYALYIKEDKAADHYAHARNYSEMGLQFAASKLKNKDIGKLL